MMVRLLLLMLLILNSFSVQAELVGEDVDYYSGETLMKGYIVYDDTFRGKRPAVLVVHEWWGHNDYARERARQLAQLGYVAMAVDMYGDGKQAKHPEDARRFSAEVSGDIALGKRRFMAAMDHLKIHKLVNKKMMAAIGYCFGGSVVLNMAREGIDLRGVVSFHGNLATKRFATPGSIKARVMVAHGGEDPFVPALQVTNFLNEMNKTGVDYKFIVYGGAKHAFTNPGASSYGARYNLPLEYNEKADRDSWNDMEIFLKDVFNE